MLRKSISLDLCVSHIFPCSTLLSPLMLFKVFSPQLVNLILTTVPWDDNVYCPHFGVKATEAQREVVTSLQSQS